MTSDEPMDTRAVNPPDVLAEIRTLFDDYECALMRNDVAALNGYFWHNPALTRYGIADRQLGYEALAAFRAATPAPDFTRELHDTRLTTFGRDMAVAQTEFTRSDSPTRGFQTQTWVRFADGWKIVAAHVSMIDWPAR